MSPNEAVPFLKCTLLSTQTFFAVRDRCCVVCGDHRPALKTTLHGQADNYLTGRIFTPHMAVCLFLDQSVKVFLFGFGEAQNKHRPPRRRIFHGHGAAMSLGDSAHDGQAQT